MLDNVFGVGSGAVTNPGMVIINAAAGDVLTLRNNTSGGSVDLSTSTGGLQTITKQQDDVLNALLSNHPALGYPTVSSVQDALNNAINELVDPDNIYVKAGAVGGNGSIAYPFGTIVQGIAAPAGEFDSFTDHRQRRNRGRPDYNERRPLRKRIHSNRRA